MHNWQESKEEFLNRWSLKNIKNMTLEEYTNLERNDSFTYWIESKTKNVIGIGGGSSYKFAIFKRNGNAEQKELKSSQKTDGDYGWYAKYGDNKVEVFKKVKELILLTIKYAIDKNFSGIDDIDLGTAFKWKIAFMYVSEGTLLRIAGKKAFEELAKKFSIESKKISEIQMQLIEKKPPDEDFYAYSSRLWDAYDLTTESDFEEDENDINNESNDESFQKICTCLDEVIAQSFEQKLELKTKIGTSINLIKHSLDSYRVIFNTDKNTYESITKENLKKFLFDGWRGNPQLGKEDGRITLFETIKTFIQNHCNYNVEKSETLQRNSKSKI